jgi:predicted hydrocarbon binding protein
MMLEIRKSQERALYNAVKVAGGAAAAAAVVYGEAGSAAAEEDAAWVESAMIRLEKRFDSGQVKQIRARCQCGYGMDEKFALVKELMEASSSLEEFANRDKAKAAGLSFAEGALYLQFPFCPCPMLAGVDRLKTAAWCQCTTGYSKVLFEKAFGCPVEVELLKSIKLGDDICLMKIIPAEVVWQ